MFETAAELLLSFSASQSPVGLYTFSASLCNKLLSDSPTFQWEPHNFCSASLTVYLVNWTLPCVSFENGFCFCSSWLMLFALSQRDEPDLFLQSFDELPGERVVCFVCSCLEATSKEFRAPHGDWTQIFPTVVFACASKCIDWTSFSHRSTCMILLLKKEREESKGYK